MATTQGKGCASRADFPPHPRWTTPDYLAAAWLAAGCAAPYPFFWAPPVWITLLMALPPAE